MTLLFTPNRVIHCVVYEVIVQVLCGLVSEGGKKEICSLSYLPKCVFRCCQSDGIEFIHTELNKSDLWIQPFCFLLFFIESDVMS